MTESPFSQEPLHNIVWMKVQDLHANSWNANRVFKAELKLLETSLLTSGWIQPIIVNSSGLIIDGFHRWRLSQDSKLVQKRWDSMVPCVIKDIPDDEAMALTVRINRAKGTHVAVDMHLLVVSLVEDYGWTIERVCSEIGASKQEIDVLLKDGVFAYKDTKNWAYSPAWYPAEGRSSELVAKHSREAMSAELAATQ